MLPAPGGPKKLLHVVIGTPDEENCPICRAHAQGKPMEKVDSPLGPILVQELPVGDILRCPCPLCVEARQEELGE